MNFIDGIAISNYRSFGPNVQKIGPCSKINIIIGKNNSGKSNILRLINFHLKRIFKYISEDKDPNFNFSDNDIHTGLTKSNIKFGFGFNIVSESMFSDYTKTLKSRSKNNFTIDFLNKIIEAFRGIDERIIWVVLEGEKRSPVIDLLENLPQIKPEKYGGRSISDCSRTLNLPSDDSYHHQLFNILKYILLDHIKIVDSVLIPDFRQIKILKNEEELIQNRTGSYNQTKSVFDGSELISSLARLDRPKPSNYNSERARFELIEKFVKEVTNSPKAKLQIPYSQDMISVDINGDNNFRPIDSLGTGIHEVVMLAAACTVNENKIVCIEEPELHLHPVLQKKFIHYINQNTNNQYFISTHSAHLLNTTGASIFHVTLENGESIVSNAYEISEKSSICRDLGYQPSDIFQTNCIIWVEGPSDRKYLKHWIKNKTSEFKEGLHYSIMFYGGKLLSNLSSEDDPLIDDFISLRKLNRRMVVIMDSDREKPKKQINSTKQRIRNEIQNNEGLVWVTKGREIENYLSEKTLEESIKAVHTGSKFKILAGTGQYGCVVKFLDSSDTEYRIDKMRVARKYIELDNEPDYNILDLDKQISNVIKFIKESNLD